MVTAIAHKHHLTHTHTCGLCVKPYSNSTSDFVSSPPASATLIHLSIQKIQNTKLSRQTIKSIKQNKLSDFVYIFKKEREEVF